jgi:hypothetical protein
LLGYEGLEVINPDGGEEDAEEEAKKGRLKQEVFLALLISQPSSSSFTIRLPVKKQGNSIDIYMCIQTYIHHVLMLIHTPICMHRCA